MRLKSAIRFISCAYMSGQASRMIWMHFVHPNVPYWPITFDIFFDWIPMLVLGLINAYWAIRDYYNAFILHESVKYRETYTDSD